MALEIWDDITGRMIMNGVDYMALESDTMMSVLYSCIVDDLVSTGASRQEVREEINKKLEEVRMIYSNRIIQNAKAKAEAAGRPLESGDLPEAEPFVLSPQMQQALGIPMYGGKP
jgi:hypothetical protein